MHCHFRWTMGVNGESMDKRQRRATLVPAPTIVAAWEPHVQFVSRFMNNFCLIGVSIRIYVFLASLNFYLFLLYNR